VTEDLLTWTEKEISGANVLPTDGGLLASRITAEFRPMFRQYEDLNNNIISNYGDISTFEDNPKLAANGKQARRGEIMITGVLRN
jgi:hypothetical protein